MMENKPETKSTPYDGLRAKIIGDHPFTGEIATCKRAEMFHQWGLVFETSWGHEFAVFEPRNVQWIDKTPNTKRR